MTKMVAPPTVTCTGTPAYIPALKDVFPATILLRLQLFSPMMWMASSTRSASVPTSMVVFPESKKPPVVASLVTENPPLVRAREAAVLSSLTYGLHGADLAAWRFLSWKNSWNTTRMTAA